MSALRDATAHLAKAEEFLAAAESNSDLGLFDAATSAAVVSGINSKDAICLKLTGTTRKSDEHAAAVSELRKAGRAGDELAPTLNWLLRLESKSQHQTVSVAQHDAGSALVWARKLLDGAREVVRS